LCFVSGCSCCCHQCTLSWIPPSSWRWWQQSRSFLGWHKVSCEWCVGTVLWRTMHRRSSMCWCYCDLQIFNKWVSTRLVVLVDHCLNCGLPHRLLDLLHLLWSLCLHRWLPLLLLQINSLWNLDLCIKNAYNPPWHNDWLKCLIVSIPDINEGAERKFYHFQLKPWNSTKTIFNFLKWYFL